MIPYFFLTIVMLATAPFAAASEGPYLATGIKIGEVDQTSAIVWVRLTKRDQRIGKEAPLPEITISTQRRVNMSREKKQSPQSGVRKSFIPGARTLKALKGQPREQMDGFV